MPASAETLKAARRMIERYGDDACRQVEARIEELGQSEGECDEAYATWCKVRMAIIALQEIPPNKTRH